MQPIAGSPFFPIFVLDNINSDFSIAHGDGLEHTMHRHLSQRIIAAEDTNFLVQSKDSYNKNYFMGGSMYEFRVYENDWNQRAAHFMNSEVYFYDRSNVKWPLG